MAKPTAPLKPAAFIMDSDSEVGRYVYELCVVYDARSTVVIDVVVTMAVWECVALLTFGNGKVVSVLASCELLQICYDWVNASRSLPALVVRSTSSMCST